jgi:hypothetical protein
MHYLQSALCEVMIPAPVLALQSELDAFIGFHSRTMFFQIRIIVDGWRVAFLPHFPAWL